MPATRNMRAQLRRARVPPAVELVVIVYDPGRRYRELCLGMDADTVCVVDAGSSSSIESREAAMAAFRELGRPNSPTEGLLVGVNDLALHKCLETKVDILRAGAT